jgi:hypothetical protein
MHQLPQLVFIHAISNRPPKIRRNHSASGTQQPLRRHMRPRKPQPLHIERLPTAPAKRHRPQAFILSRYLCKTPIANWNQPRSHQRPTTSPAIRRKNSRYKIPHSRPSPHLRTSQHAQPRAPSHHLAGWSPGRAIERIVIQALAEDAPHSPALQVGRTAPCTQYKPSPTLNANQFPANKPAIAAILPPCAASFLPPP